MSLCDIAKFSAARKAKLRFAQRLVWELPVEQRASLEAMSLAESVMLEKAKDFAVDIVNLCRAIKQNQHESVLTNQLLRCGTSIGANIHESKYAQSTADFVSKMQIALKECYESEYWMELLYRTHYISAEQYHPLRNTCGALRRMLVSSINTTKGAPPL